ncbi:MAG: prepilin-type N-terminal cleavage/methylation domain-containing protein [Homoserinimonas sp.]
MKSESGMSLVELLVYSLLLGIVLALIGGLLINGLVTERTVRNSAEATTTGQLAARSVSHGVRAATALELSALSGDPQVLRALIVDDALSSPVASHCAAWYYGGGELRTTRAAGMIPLPTTAADVESWTLLASGVEPAGASPVFTLDPTTRDVEFIMQLSHGDGLNALIETTALSRQPATPPAGSVTCF